LSVIQSDDNSIFEVEQRDPRGQDYSL